VKRDRLELVMMGPRLGVSGIDWIAEYLRFREDSCLPLGKYPLFPAFDEGSWSTLPANQSDINAIFKACLFECGAEEAAAVTSHSFKATYLKMAASYGIPSDARRALGYHKRASESSVRAYARDSLSHPVRLLISMLDEIQRGTFNPDERLGASRPLASGVQAPELTLDSNHGDISSSSSHSSDESEASHVGIDILNKVVAGSNPIADNRWYENVDSGKHHRGKSGDLDHLACGVLISEGYRRLASGPAESVDDESDLCKRCFGRTHDKQCSAVRAMNDPELL